MTNSGNLPVEILEARAREQRDRLHNSVDELKSTVRQNVRERLDVRGYARNYFWQTAAAVSLVALLAGYGIAAPFAPAVITAEIQRHH